MTEQDMNNLFVDDGGFGTLGEGLSKDGIRLRSDIFKTTGALSVTRRTVVTSDEKST